MTKPLKNIKKQVMEDDLAEDNMEGEVEIETTPMPDMADMQDNPSAETLISSLKVTLADVFAVYVKSSYFHWNIEGPDFVQYHGLLGQIYEDVQGSIDPIAENIRKLGGYAPGSFSRYQELTAIPEASKAIPPAIDMLREIYNDLGTLIASNERSYELAEMNHEHGISNFLGERDGILKKHRWFLRATLANR
jgi:starvation-inducible DNA-binding protein